jgi:hypothetical protein
MIKNKNLNYKKDALIWARRKMHAMTVGSDEARLVQINKFLTGIQFTFEELKWQV